MSSITQDRRANVDMAKINDSSDEVLRASDETTFKCHGATQYPFSEVVVEDDHHTNCPIMPEGVKGDTTGLCSMTKAIFQKLPRGFLVASCDFENKRD